MKIHGVILSPFVRKVLAIAKLKQLAFENEMVFPGTDSPEFLAISPLGKIPAFEDGDLHISDSSVICEYLDDRYPDIPARPTDPADKARARWFEEYGDSKLVELCGGGIFFERFVKKVMGLGEVDEAKVKQTIEELLPPQQDYLERVLPDDGFLFNDFGVADISIAGPFINAEHVGYTPDSARWPKLTAFIERVKAHPIIAELVDAEKQLLASMA